MVYGFQQTLTSLYNNYCMHYIQDRTDPHKIFLDTYSHKKFEFQNCMNCSVLLFKNCNNFIKEMIAKDMAMSEVTICKCSMLHVFKLFDILK